MEFSTDILEFEDEPNQHQMTKILIKNISDDDLTFKFKASMTKRCIIKPNSGKLKKGQQTQVQIVIHREIIPNISHEKIQIVYGKNLEENHASKFFQCELKEKPKANLNLTMVVEQKQLRVKQLSDQVNQWKKMPLTKSKPSTQISFSLKLLIIMILGLLVGYFGPFKIFKKRVIHHS